MIIRINVFRNSVSFGGFIIKSARYRNEVSGRNIFINKRTNLLTEIELSNIK